MAAGLALAAYVGKDWARCTGGGVNFVNSREAIVSEAIDGLVSSHPFLARLSGDPDIKVVVRSDWEGPSNAHKVAIVSGGGAGHEPSHAGFVGPGMLTAAVSGDVFASPSAEAVLAAIRRVAYPGGDAQRRAGDSPGVLLIVKNYTGDRINFGIALQQARSEGIPVEMVVVADDCALPRSKGITGRRGIAGTVLVHKVAGAAAEAGCNLKQVAAEAQAVASSVASLGVSASVCHVPGRAEDSARLPSGKVEMGLGIHGEPGYQTVDLAPVDSLVEDMLCTINDDSKDRAYLGLRRGDEVVLLVNNLGSATPLETNIAVRAAVENLRRRGIRTARIVSGALMTSMDMSGLSISLLPLVKDTRSRVLLRLDSNTDAPGWPRGGGAPIGRPKAIPIPSDARDSSFIRPSRLDSTGQAVERVLRGVAVALAKAEPQLTAWDAKVGDGDCGQTFKSGADAVLRNLDKYPVNSVQQSLQAVTDTLATSMGGTSGALYRIFLLSLCNSAKTWAKDASDVGTCEAAFALQTAVDEISKAGGASENDRTMLDALIPSVRAMNEAADLGLPLTVAMEKAVLAAESGADATKSMRAQAGRSNYVPLAVTRQVPDPGAKAVAIWMRAAFEALRN